MNKKSLRKYYLQKRQELKGLNEDLKIINNFLTTSIFKKSKSIFVTIPVRNEINTIPIIKKSLELGKRVFLPKTNLELNEIDLIEIFDYPGNLRKGTYGIPEPIGKSNKLFVPELTIVPGLAFSIDGYRLGYGGGYYDRFLQNKKTFSVGLIYNELLVSSLPIEEFDLPVDFIVTPKALIQTNHK